MKLRCGIPLLCFVCSQLLVVWCVTIFIVIILFHHQEVESMVLMFIVQRLIESNVHCEASLLRIWYAALIASLSLMLCSNSWAWIVSSSDSSVYISCFKQPPVILLQWFCPIYSLGQISLLSMIITWCDWTWSSKCAGLFECMLI